jgi:hypothetical protein
VPFHCDVLVADARRLLVDGHDYEAYEGARFTPCVGVHLLKGEPMQLQVGGCVQVAGHLVADAVEDHVTEEALWRVPAHVVVGRGSGRSRRSRSTSTRTRLTGSTLRDVDGVQQPFPVVTNSDSCALDYLGVATTSIHLCGRWVWWWCCESKVKEASSKMEGLRFVRYNFILLNSVARWWETIVGTLPVTTLRVDAEAVGDGVDFLLRC